MSITPAHRRAPFALLALALLAACSTAGDDGLAPVPLADATGVIFITQNVVPGLTMEALFQGRVVLDGAGCLRLDSPDPATVVWPKGFTIVADGDTLRVRDASGRVIGHVGGRFNLGGGELGSLHASVPVSDADRARAHASCPGGYWIVGDVMQAM